MERTQQERKLIREPVKVIIYLENCRITGTVYLGLETRLSDFINSDLQFLPVTDAKVDSILPGHKWSYKVNFMDLNKN
ncbi:MAG: hypothetical protein QME68_01335, partial [Elusimicrobiota bacterium]|nr:hypothetical protein [Elusimicrobiota bacterium]